MKSHVATRRGVARAYTLENVGTRATFRLTLDVITQNLTVTLGTTLSETLTNPMLLSLNERIPSAKNPTFPPLPRPDIVS